MGFTISNYSLFGLQQQNFYVSIHGAFQIRKNRSSISTTSNSETSLQDVTCYVIGYTIYYHASANSPSITQKDDCFSIGQLPEPAHIYPVIYDNIKKTLDPQYKTNAQTLVFTDDIDESYTFR